MLSSKHSWDLRFSPKGTLQYIQLFTMVILCQCASATLFAQSAVMSGVVSEAQSGEAVIGVNVIVSSDSTNFSKSALVRGTRTNKFGFYFRIKYSRALFFKWRG
jgi:hypothetical protein